MWQRSIAACAWAGLLGMAGLTACGGHGEEKNLGGTVAGLHAGNSVTLKNNGDGDTITVSENAAFQFAVFVAADTSYTVVVVAQPAGQTCSVVNGTGRTDSSADPVNNIQVNCT